MSKFYSMLGIGRKAGFIDAGETPCLIALKRKKCYLIILAEDASDNTKKKFMKICAKDTIDYVFYGDKDRLGNAIGKNLISVIAVKNKDFVDQLMKLI